MHKYHIKPKGTFSEYYDEIVEASRKKVEDLATELLDGLTYYTYEGVKAHTKRPELSGRAYYTSVMSKVDELDNGQLLVFEDTCKSNGVIIFEVIGPIKNIQPTTAVVPRVGTEIRLIGDTTITSSLPLWAGRALRCFRLPTVEEVQYYQNSITI